MQALIEQSGYLLYTLPVALLVLLSREAFRNFLLSRLAKEETYPAAYYVDIFSVVSLALTGGGWGGLLHRKRRDTLLTFSLSQFWLLMLVGLGVLYWYLKKPDAGSYVSFFTLTFVKQCWVLFFINFIPLPPFDAAYFYFQPMSGGKLTPLLHSLMKTIAILLFLTLPWKTAFWAADFLVK